MVAFTPEHDADAEAMHYPMAVLVVSAEVTVEAEGNTNKAYRARARRI